MGAREAPLIIITGPTASGKTSLAIELAKRYNGEIICADSRTVYRGMDIGTAKPTALEQKTVPHWGLDLVLPSEKYSAAQFQVYAREVIRDIRARGRVPFLVGGTGLYIDAILFGFQFGGLADQEQRHRLSQLTIEELQVYCEKNNIKLPENTKNKRYLIRSIERCHNSNKNQITPLNNATIVGITTNKTELRTRIEVRAEQLFKHGIVEEAIELGKEYGWSSEAMTGNIYRIVHRYINGEINHAELYQEFITSDWRLAKRQMTWMRRNPYILWGNTSSVKEYISGVLESY